MPATEFLAADLLCLVTHGILKADVFDADGRGEWSILGRVVEFGRLVTVLGGEPLSKRHQY
jgi:hypothetical protein